MECRILCTVFTLIILSAPSFQESCFSPLGMGDGRIKSDQIYVTEPHKKWYGKDALRLTDKNIVWMPANQSLGQYVQIDLLEVHTITGVETQGFAQIYPLYIKTFALAYGFDGKSFKEYEDENGNIQIFKANTEVYGKKINFVFPAIKARFIRLYPLTWRRKIALKMELHGCKIRNCSINNGGCSEICTQVDDITVKCSCKKSGYEEVKGKCQDIDECLKAPCQQNCNNTDGSFTCSCRNGYELRADGRTCKDVNECSSLNVTICDQKCVNKDGSYECQCFDGYKFSADKYHCIDIDECEKDNGGCDQNCTNSIGSFSCSCKSGYELYLKKKCRDVDECDFVTGVNKCQQLCKNTIGGYTCDCYPGYDVNPDGYDCDDIDECKNHNGNCSNECVNTIGSYKCKCPTGYELDYIKRNCLDINECSPHGGNNSCEQVCNNNPGSYTCSCFSGYELKDDKQSCQDRDECADSKLNDCDPVTTNCKNTQPSYTCDCKKGYEPYNGQTLSCTKVKCGAIPRSYTYTVSPSSCLNGDQNTYEKVCQFKCTEGYKPVNTAQSMSLECLSTRQWDNPIPACQGVKCPNIPTGINGQLSPASCAIGVRYPDTCSLSCNSGYVHVGASSINCQKDATFSSDISQFACKKDVLKPTIHCRPLYQVVLPKGKDSVVLPDNWYQVSTSVGTISMSHPKDYQYPYGETEVTFTATWKGEQSHCIVKVKVLDKEAPKIVYCPKDIIYVKINATYKYVQWQKPHFSDNTGVVSVKGDKEFGEIKPGSYVIGYIAEDASGNRNYDCQINLVVTQDNPCSTHLILQREGTAKYCRSTRCIIRCLPSRQFYKNGKTMERIDCNPLTGWSKAALNLPECVEFSTKVESGCPAGSEPFSDKCINCPTGHYSDGTSCQLCPLNKYQDQQNSASCKDCPDGTGTSKVGSNICQELCQKGFYTTSDGKCLLCPIGTYQPDFGKTSCISCSGDLTTTSTGTINERQCGRIGTITIKPGKNVTVDVGDDVDIACESSALPFDMKWEKEVNTPGDAGYRPGVLPIFHNQKLIGRTYRIRGVKYNDRGVYICKTKNAFGSNEEKVYLNVNIDVVIVGK